MVPSEAVKCQKHEESKDLSIDEINYQVFTTRDCVRIGMKFLVSYKITNPELTLSTLMC